MARFTGYFRAGLDISEAGSGRSWQVRWARMMRDPLNIVLTTDFSWVWENPAVAVTLDDGRTLLATGNGDNRGAAVWLWDPITGAAVGEPLTGHTDYIVTLATIQQPTGRTLLASGSWDSTVRLWDPATGTQVGDPLIGHTDAVVALAVMPMGSGRVLLASGSWDSTVRLWDPATGTQVGDPLIGHTARIEALSAIHMSDGRHLLASGGRDYKVCLWEPAAGALVDELLLEEHADYLKALKEHRRHDLLKAEVTELAAVSMPDGRAVLAIGRRDGPLQLWDPTASGQACAPLGIPTSQRLLATVPQPGGHHLLAIKAEDTVRLWDPVTGAPVTGPIIGRQGVSSMAAIQLPDGRTLLGTTSGETVRLWEPAVAGSGDDSSIAHQARVYAVTVVTLTNGRRLIATGDEKSTVKLWDAATGDVIGDPLSGHSGSIHALASVPMQNGQTLLASSSGDGTLRLWDPTTGTPVLESQMSQTKDVRSLTAARLPDGRILLVSGCWDGIVRLWDPVTGTQVGALAGHKGAVLSVAAVTLPDGRAVLASRDMNGTVRLWDLKLGTQLGKPLHKGNVMAVMPLTWLSLADKRTLLAIAYHDTVWLWDPASGSETGALNADLVSGLATIRTSDGRVLLAAASMGDRIWLWDPLTCNLVRTFETGFPECWQLAAFDSNLFLAGGDGILVVDFK